METYHFDKLSDRKFNITESEIVAELFKMYEKLTEEKLWKIVSLSQIRLFPNPIRVAIFIC